jgi:DNA polymerase-3 subunit delta
MTFSAFGRSLEKGIGPLYAFLGRDDFLKSSCVRYVCQAAGDGDEPCVPADFDGDSADIRAVFDELRTLPLLDDRRVVRVDKANAFLERCSDSDMETLPGLGRGSVLILTDEKLDGRRKLTKEVFEKGVVVNCDEMDEADLTRWLTRRMVESGKKPASGAVKRMIERVGPGPASLDQAVEQLITYTGSQEAVTPADVEEALPAAASEEVWSLTDGVAARDRAGSLAVIDDLMAHGEPVQMVVGAFAWHVRRLLNAKFMLEGGMREADVFRDLHVYGSRASRFRSQLSNFSLDEVKRNLALLTEADLRLKTSGHTRERLILERTVLEMCG